MQPQAAQPQGTSREQHERLRLDYTRVKDALLGLLAFCEEHQRQANAMGMPSWYARGDPDPLERAREALQ